MATGKVKWFNNAKGYGFILSDEGEEDLFAHFSSIQMDGYKTLKAGQSVGYDLVEGPKGNHAVNIREADEATSEVNSEAPASEVQASEVQASEAQASDTQTLEHTDEQDISEDSTADSIGNH